MQILNNTSIAVGIEWTLHESLAQAKKAAAGKKKVLVARKVISGECVQGLCAAPPKARKLQAGALLAAAVASDVLIYHSLDNGQAWVCAVREGIPLHGFDVVTDEENARAVLAEVMSYVPTADIYGDITGAKGTLDELFAQISPRDRKAAALAVPDSPVVVILLIVFVLLLIAIAILVFLMLGKSKTSGLPIQNEEELRKARIAFAAQVAEQKRVFWHARSPVQQYVLWYDVLRNVPVSAEGWTPGAFRCDPENCQMTWKRGTRALLSPAAQLPGKTSVPPFNPVLKEASSSFPPQKTPVIEHRQGPAGLDRFLADLGVRTTPVKLTVNPSQSSIVVQPPAGVQGLAPVTLGREGGWRLESDNPLLLPEFLSRMELPGITVTRLNIKSMTPGRPYRIELEGRYRVGN